MEMAEKNHGYVTALQVSKENIPRVYLSLLVDKGLLEKTERGIYITPTTFEDEMFNLQFRFTRGIFSHETALFLHGLSDRTPIRYTMTFPTGYNTTSVRKENVITFSSVRYELGISTIPTPFGSQVSAYNAERTLCDIIQKRSHTDVQVIAQAFNLYLRQQCFDIPLLSEYATALRVEKRLSSYLEVLL